MEYLAIKEKKIAKPKKPVNIIFSFKGENGEKGEVNIVDRTRTSGLNREEVMKRLHLLNPTVKSTVLTKSVIVDVPSVMSYKKNIENVDESEEVKDESEKEVKEREKKERKDEIESEIRLFEEAEGEKGEGEGESGST